MGTKRRELLLAACAILCIGALVGDRFVVTPLWGLWSTRTARIAGLTEQLEKGAILLDREDVMEGRWKDMKERALSAEVSVAENSVLMSVNRWVQESGLGVTSLKPRWTQDRKGPEELEVRIAARGSMGAIARFLFELEQDPMALNIEEAAIVARDDAGLALTLDLRFTALTLADVAL